MNLIRGFTDGYQQRKYKTKPIFHQNHLLVLVVLVFNKLLNVSKITTNTSLLSFSDWSNWSHHPVLIYKQQYHSCRLIILHVVLLNKRTYDDTQVLLPYLMKDRE